MCKPFKVKLCIHIRIGNSGMREYMKKIGDKDQISKTCRAEFTKIVELPVEPKSGDYINVRPCGFSWKNKTIDIIEDDDSNDKLYFKAIRTDTMILKKDKGTLKGSIEYLISSYKKCGWKLEYIPEVWQEIIDTSDD